MLASLLRPATGLPLPVRADAATWPANSATPSCLPSTPAWNRHWARKAIGSMCFQTPIIHITAATPAGLFYGGQTLRQLLPAAVYAKTEQAGVKWQVPCCRIEDQPRFPWRGLLLDECRHFFGKEFVKHYIDLLAAHKLNTLHWHLTDDQGWRIEIKKYPKLTEIGSWRDQTEGDGKRYGGFYTQDEIREIVAYAARRHVTIVPEIEMPGHSLGGPHGLSAVLLHGRAVQGPHRLGRGRGCLLRRQRCHVRLPGRRARRSRGSVPLDLHPYRRRRMPQGPLEEMSQVPGPDQGRGPQE